MFPLNLLLSVNLVVHSRAMVQHEQMIRPPLLPNKFSLFQAGDHLLNIPKHVSMQ